MSLFSIYYKALKVTALLMLLFFFNLILLPKMLSSHTDLFWLVPLITVAVDGLLVITAIKLINSFKTQIKETKNND